MLRTGSIQSGVLVLFPVIEQMHAALACLLHKGGRRAAPAKEDKGLSGPRRERGAGTPGDLPNDPPKTSKRSARLQVWLNLA